MVNKLANNCKVDNDRVELVVVFYGGYSFTNNEPFKPLFRCLLPYSIPEILFPLYVVFFFPKSEKNSKITLWNMFTVSLSLSLPLAFVCGGGKIKAYKIIKERNKPPSL